MEQSNEELEVVKVDDEVDINEEKIRDDRLAEPKTRGKYFAERGSICLGHFWAEFFVFCRTPQNLNDFEKENC